MFDEEDFGNLEQCFNYVEGKSYEYNLGLSSMSEIKRVAKMYAEALEKYGYYGFVENDEILLDVARKYRANLSAEEMMEDVDNYKVPATSKFVDIRSLIHEQDNPTDLEPLYDEFADDEEGVLDYLSSLDDPDIYSDDSEDKDDIDLSNEDVGPLL